MTEAKLECYTRRDGKRTIFCMEGTLDVVTAPAGQEALLGFVADQGPHVVLDTSRLDFIDSKGVGVLISAAKAARDAKGGIYLLNPATPVRKILETCGLTALFPPAPPAAAEPAAAESAPPRPAAPRAPARTARRAA
jgi:anti-sigma B factor antagonist